MFDFGILGNNARNLNYIKKFNDRKSIYLANNKLETKKFLSERGIPFAKTYAVIKNRKELYDFDFSNLPKKDFVVKPNQGSKGEGVLIVKKIKETEIKNEKSTNFLIGGKIISESKLKRYLLDIIGGKYSMTNGNDQIIVEEKLIAGESFKDFCEYGLADIRIIVFNLVPVAAMIRMPTVDSGWKANLAQGGLGFGIEIGTGKIKSMLKKNKILTSNFPLEYTNLLNKKMPYRNDILFLSSKIQFFVNLGYLALDWVITQDGPKLLEINARAGLEVQKVANIRLKKILEKISDLKIIDPEKGVEIAKTLLTSEKTNLNTSKILYLSQNGKLTYKSENIENAIDVIVQVDLNKQESQISHSLCEKLNYGKKLKFDLDIYDNEINFKQIKLNKSEQIQGNKVIIGKDLANEYLIKPHHKIFENIEILNPTKIIKAENDLLKQIDQRIEKTSKKLILAVRLRPLNYFEELDNFITLNGKYNPQFKYKRPSEERLEETKLQLDQLYEKLNGDTIKSDFKKLFVEKVNELYDKLNLIKAYKIQDFENILKYNFKIFGNFDNELLKISKEKIFSNIDQNKNLLGKSLSLDEIQKAIEKHLIERGIYGVNVVSNYTNLSRISITMGKNIKINIGKGAIFREKELESILAHEIDTHLIRYINGMKSGREIFKSGTGYYLQDEEGLAIYNANKILAKDNENSQIDYGKIGFYKKYFLTKESMNYNFAKIVELTKFLYPDRSMERLFKTVIKAKKGINDTSVITNGSIFLKEKVYLDGYTKINNWIKDGNNIENMNKGKIKTDDLEFIF